MLHENQPLKPAITAASAEAIGKLLEARQYEQVITLLSEPQADGGQPGVAAQTRIVAAARQICLACDQCLNEESWHQRALTEATRREQLLTQQLRDLLALISEPNAAAQLRGREVGHPRPAPPPAAPADAPTLWQRVQQLLRGVVGAPQAEPEAAAALRDGPDGAQDRHEPALVFYCLGPFRVFLNDQPVGDWTSQKSLAILKYLLLHRSGPAAKDVLIELFWPEADLKSARRSLHQAIYSLRQTLRRAGLEAQPVLFEQDRYALNPQLQLWVDVEEFERRIERGRMLEASGDALGALLQYGVAEGLYQGELVQDDLYEDWPRRLREHYRSLYLDIAGRLSEHYAQQGEHIVAIELCRKILAQDACHEEAHLRLMHGYLAQGQRHLAVRQHQIFVEALADELDLEPSEEAQALFERIVRRQAPPGDAAEPPG